MSENFTVLLVDDHAKTRKVMQALLRANGLTEVLHARDGTEALAQLAQHDVSLVVSDYYMSPINGLTLLEKMRDEIAYADIPFVLVSADDDLSLIRRAARSRVEILIKPFQAAQLRECLVRAVGQSWLPQPLRLAAG